MDERTSDGSEDENDYPLVDQSSEETGTDNTTATVDHNQINTDDLVAQHTADRNEELQKVLKLIEELTLTVSDKEARCNELEGVVVEPKIRGKELEINITEFSKRNADLERMNTEL